MESEFKKDLNPAPKSKPARLCITVDKFFKPVHIKIISNELRDYNRYCRNEAADALLHQTPDILQRRVVSFEFQDPKMIPPISPDNNDSYLKQIREMSKHPNNHISIMYDKYLRDDIGLFISKVPRQHLISRYGIVPDSPHTINIPELYDGTNKPLVRDVLLHNNFLDCELIESPQSSWLFTDTDSGIKQMSAFSTSISSTPAWTSIGSPSQQYGLTETICRGRQINLQWMILRKTICCWQMRSKRKKSRSGKSLLNMILALIPKTTGDSSVNTPMTLLTAVTK